MSPLCHTAISHCLNRLLNEALSSYQFVHLFRVPVWLVHKSMPLPHVHCSVCICVYLKFICVCHSCLRRYHHSCLNAGRVMTLTGRYQSYSESWLQSCVPISLATRTVWKGESVVTAATTYDFHGRSLCKHPHVLWIGWWALTLYPGVSECDNIHHAF